MTQGLAVPKTETVLNLLLTFRGILQVAENNAICTI